MKKHYLCLYLLFVSALVMAQAQFTANNCFQVNDSTRLGSANYQQNFDSFRNQTGSNYTWDFSTTGWTNLAGTCTFYPAASSPHAVPAGIEINEIAMAGFGRDLYYTYSSDKDTLYFNGRYNSGTDYLYIPRIPYLSFPLNYNDSVYTITYQYAYTPDPTHKTGKIERYWIYDGYGTVKLPYGTINNVYRIRTHQVDSSYIVFNGPVYDEMIWFRASDGIPVLRFIKNGDFFTTVYFASANGAAGIAENSNVSHINIYPSPFTSSITIKNTTNKAIARVNIYNTLGTLVLTKTSSTEVINTEHLAQGLYNVEVLFEDKMSICKRILK